MDDPDGDSSGRAYNMRLNLGSSKVYPSLGSNRGSEGEPASMKRRLFSSSISIASAEPRESRLTMTNRFNNFLVLSYDITVLKWLKFEDSKVERDFRVLQKKAVRKVIVQVLVLMCLFELTNIVYDFVVKPGPANVQAFRFGLCALTMLLKCSYAFIAARNRSRWLEHLMPATIFLVIVQSATLVLMEHTRSLATLGEDVYTICKKDNSSELIANIYCDKLNGGVLHSDSLVLLCLAIVLATISYSLDMFVISLVSPLFTVFVYISISVVLSISIHYINAMMLTLFGFICAWGALLSENRMRELYERTLLSKEAMRRNRKLRASFDRHVDNERSLIEQAQILHAENKKLRNKADGPDISMESPLLSAINDLRDVQRTSKIQKTNGSKVNLHETLERVIKSLQSTQVAEIDIRTSTMHDNSLDAKTREWLTDATSGWEQRRMNNRKGRLSKPNRKDARKGSVLITHAGDLSSLVAPMSPTHSESFENVFDANGDDKGDAEKGEAEKEEAEKHDTTDFPAENIKNGEIEDAESKPQLPILYQPEKQIIVGNKNGDAMYNSYLVRGSKRKMNGASPEDLEMRYMLEESLDWDSFDVIKFAGLTSYPVTALVDFVVAKQQTLHFVDISYSRLINFMQTIDMTYCYQQSVTMTSRQLKEKRNPYHNNMHAADVVHGVYCFLSHAEIFKEMSRLDLFACVIAAAIHDYHHPGRTNQFLVTQSHPIAIHHNDQSPNERYHLSEAFRMMQEDERNFLVRLQPKTRLEVRQTIIDLVLSTDLAMTMKYLSSFQMLLAKKKDEKTEGLINRDNLTTVKEETRTLSDLNNSSSSSGVMDAGESILLLQIAIKVADISHPSRRLQLHKDWTERIQAEFFLQGDIQREDGLKVDPLCDRHNVDVNKAQMGFIDFVCRPLIQPFAQFIEMPILIDNLNSNYKYWSDRNQLKEANDEKA